jgi:uncharacterized protein YkwD
MKRRQVLAAGLLLTSGCTGTRAGSESDGGTTTTPTTSTPTPTPPPTTTSEPDTDTPTPTPQGEFSPAAFRQEILQKLNSARENWGLAPLTPNDALEELAQSLADGKPGPMSAEQVRTELEAVGCDEGDIIFTHEQFDHPVEVPGGDGLTRVESPAEYASLIRKRWMQPDEERQTILEGEYARIGIGNVYTDSGHAYTIVAFCV